MFTFTWCIIAPLLLFVPFTFLTIIGFSSFCSLNLCFAAIFLSMNIPIILLSKSAFTIIPLCVSTFSTPMFNHTSLSILNILLTFLCLSSFFTILFRTPIYMLPCCAFFCLEYTTTLQSHHGCFLLVLYSGHRILFLSSFNTSTTIFLYLY